MHDMVYLNGRILPRAEAHISPFDHGFTVGDGVFESLITYDGKPFGLREHWERLMKSAAALQLSGPTLENFHNAVTSIIEANRLGTARLRVTLTGGEAALGSDQSTQSQPTFVVASMDVPQRPPLAKIATVRWPRNERSALAQVKSTSYAENVIALAAAKAMGAQEAILANTRGELCEGTGSNIFLVLSGQLHTPPLASGCLAGVTRHFVLQLCEQLGLAVQQTPVAMTQLPMASEAFLTSTYREIQAISQVDHHVIPAPGPITLQLQEAFQRLKTSFGLREMDSQAMAFIDS
jgi:branched-chain amino acid aminotransferase